MTAIALPRQPHSAWLERLRSIQLGLGARGAADVALAEGKPGAAVSGVNWREAGGATGCIAAYQPKGAASLAASYSNLANPGTYDATPGVAPTWSGATGWFCDGSCWMSTGIVPANDQTWSMIAAFANASGMSGHTIAGSQSTDNTRFYLIPRRGAPYDNRIYGNGSNAAFGTRLTAGVMAIAGSSAYLDGSLEGTITTGWNGSALHILIGALNYMGSPNQFFVGNILALAIYNTTLTAPQVVAVSVAMAAL